MSIVSKEKQTFVCKFTFNAVKKRLCLINFTHKHTIPAFSIKQSQDRLVRGERLVTTYPDLNLKKYFVYIISMIGLIYLLMPKEKNLYLW